MDDADQNSGWYSEDEATFGDRLAGAREAEAMSQAELARRLGVKVATLRNWENDLSEPRANKLNMASGVLNVSLRWLLTGEGEGVNLPEGEPDHTPEIRGILREIRDLRTQMNSSAERLARLEKTLRKRFEGGQV
ncbi:helix-turn-helix domain-containing protein [Aliiroseovarius crassostreae]|uniref:Helix-turn-helix domain-containing protein n=1 Tax=Aliiroseovarius crassostreae TaxID=154981 RepID=A0A9Q9HF89_9RHOB|nr:helix-turn-helix transcriptional regulator [Aliiroseovarius crassostreae]UWP89935.1 helix-turn-helix domain-containing protein [Aliiroseovarius crassostreae]UWP93094.1 helix-turn-helix domain-containing protein [Aliiroseovarius crassostreae]UWP96230.1 helix-turn-helix domain-containing protein [Aliiroseovarius crassostreae]UWP99390.1 helix-turn-helix domain-containing protein [Aliiroseovarius crassostreae]